MQVHTACLDATRSPPLVLLPGTLCDDAVFAPLLARLPARLPARATMVGDMHGLASTAALARRVLAAAPRQFALLGFSLGALVALEIAAQAPDRVAGLALVAGNGHALPVHERAARRAAAAAVRCVADHVGGTLWAGSVADPDDAELRAAIMAMARRCPPGTLPTQVEVAVTRADSLPRLGALRMPTLVLGGAQDAINPPACQQRLVDGIPGARLAIVPRAGHFMLLEQPDACARAVGEWLAAVDSAAATAMAADGAADNGAAGAAEPMQQEIV